MDEKIGSYELCIIIPCYQNIPGLIESVRSIRFLPGKYILVIVDDGNETAITEEDIRPYTLADLKILRMPVNMGIVDALNSALNTIGILFNTIFIARLDCGDICDGNKFYLQAEALRNDNDLSLVGSWCLFKEYKSDRSYIYKTPSSHKAIMRGLPFRNLFIHPSVMWRYENQLILYPCKFPYAEDYAFFYAKAKIGKTLIIPSVLITCEVNERGISLSNRKEQLNSRKLVVRNYCNSPILKYCGILKLNILQLIPYRWIWTLKAKKS